MTIRLDISQILLSLVATLMLHDLAGENLRADLNTDHVHFLGLNLQQCYWESQFNVQCTMSSSTLDQSFIRFLEIYTTNTQYLCPSSTKKLSNWLLNFFLFSITITSLAWKSTKSQPNINLSFRFISSLKNIIKTQSQKHGNLINKPRSDSFSLSKLFLNIGPINVYDSII